MIANEVAVTAQLFTTAKNSVCRVAQSMTGQTVKRMTKKMSMSPFQNHKERGVPAKKLAPSVQLGVE